MAEMNKKIVIPTILAATILVAGFVALMPVERASTVHTTIQNGINAQDQYISLTFTASGGNLAATPITLASENAYAGRVTVVNGLSADINNAADCESSAIVSADTNNDGAGDNDFATATAADNIIAANAAIPAGADQLFIRTTNVGATDVCTVNVIVMLTSTVS